MLLRHQSSSWLLLCLLAIMAVAEISSLRGKSPTYDEATHHAYGQRGVHQGTFDRGHSKFDATMPISALNVLGADLVLGAGEPADFAKRLFWARLPTVVLSLLLVAVVFAWAAELFGRAAALMAAFLCALSPNILAHGRLVTTDIALTLAFFSATYLFWRYLRAPSRGRLAAAGLAFGFAQLTKITALFLVVIFFLLIALRAFDRWRRGREATAVDGSLPRELLALGGLCVFAMVIVNAGFLFEGTFSSLADYDFKSERMQHLQQVRGLRCLPLPAPVPFVQGVDMVSYDMARDRWTYCLGEHRPQGFWYYYLVAYGLKVPISMLLLLVLAVGGRFYRKGRIDRKSQGWGDDLFLWVPSAFLFVYLSLFYQYQIGLRHLLPIFPFLFVFVSRLAVVEPRRWRRFWVWGRGLLLVSYAWSSFSIYPHYLAYFNELRGGPEEGWRYLVDSNLDWGQDQARARYIYAKNSPVPVYIEPKRRMAGRILVSVNRLAGLKPKWKNRYAWLRENFEPVDHVGYSWKVYDISEDDLRRCCADSFQPLPAAEGNLAPLGKPIGRSKDSKIEQLELLNDQSLGAGAPIDAAVSQPYRGRPMGGWFGIDWGKDPQVIDRIRAYPSVRAWGRYRKKFLALDLVVDRWDGSAWREIPGTRISGNEATEVEIRFPPVRTTKIRLRILKARNNKGLVSDQGRFRIACLELAAFGPGKNIED